MGKKNSTKILREELIDYLLAHGWEPNIEYWGLDPRYPEKKTVSDRGCYIKYYPPYDSKTKQYDWANPVVNVHEGTNYLIASDKSYALTVKKTVITVHQASRQFCKVLSLNISDIQYTEDGIYTGLLMLRNHPCK